MSEALFRPLARSGAAPNARVASRPYWNPYFVGVLLGLVLLATYVVTARGLGATGAFSSVAAWLAGLFSPEHVAGNPVHSRYLNEGAPLLSWTVFLLLGAFAGAHLSGRQAGRVRISIERGPRITDRGRLALAFCGGFLAAFGAKLAKGCTSGQALTGGALLNLGSWAFMLSVFAGAYAVALVFRFQWR
jgi:hypothetical protein